MKKHEKKTSFKEAYFFTDGIISLTGIQLLGGGGEGGGGGGSFRFVI